MEIYEMDDASVSVRWGLTDKGVQKHIYFNNMDEVEQFADDLNQLLIERDEYQQTDTDDGWIENTGVAPDYEGFVDVMFRDGETYYRQNQTFRWSLINNDS
ncbi:hypothetical protein ACI3PL_15605, partial [Lacticaseibacillus paracasei]